MKIRQDCARKIKSSIEVAMNHFLPRIDGGAREALGCSHEPDQIDARVYPAKLGCSLCNCVFYRGRLFCIQCEMRQIINSVPLY